MRLSGRVGEKFPAVRQAHNRTHVYLFLLQIGHLQLLLAFAGQILLRSENLVLEMYLRKTADDLSSEWAAIRETDTANLSFP